MLGSQSSIRSKQLYHLELDGGRCELAAPDSRLDSFVDYYWLLSIDQPSLVLEVVPDTAIDLVLSPDMANFAALYFPVSEQFNIQLEGPVQYAGISFRSHTAPELLRSDFGVLRALNVGADTSEHLQIGPLLADIQHVDRIDTISERFDRFWLAQLGQKSTEKTSRARISHQEMIRVVESSVGSGSIAGICKTLNVSERQFRRLSKDLFGLSPKKLQNILRLQSALDELFRSQSSQLQDLYYDDSHRIKELKRLTGCTPSQIRKMAEKYNNPVS